MSQKNVVFHPSLPFGFFRLRLFFPISRTRKNAAMLWADNTLKIIDFGIAAHFEALELTFVTQETWGFSSQLCYRSVPKMEGFLNLMSYISRIHTAYRWGFLHFRYLKYLVRLWVGFTVVVLSVAEDFIFFSPTLDVFSWEWNREGFRFFLYKREKRIPIANFREPQWMVFLFQRQGIVMIA